MKFEVRVEEYHGEEWVEAEGVDREQAAERFAEEYWSDEPTDPNNFRLEVEVRVPGETTAKTFVVHGSVSVDFYAEEKRS